MNEEERQLQMDPLGSLLLLLFCWSILLLLEIEMTKDNDINREIDSIDNDTKFAL